MLLTHTNINKIYNYQTGENPVEEHVAQRACRAQSSELDKSVPLRSATRTRMKLNVISREISLGIGVLTINTTGEWLCLILCAWVLPVRNGKQTKI